MDTRLVLRSSNASLPMLSQDHICNRRKNVYEQVIAIELSEIFFLQMILLFILARTELGGVVEQ